MAADTARLFQPLELPCGVVLKHRIAKSAMSDSLGDGRGNPTPAQTRLYERWAEGGVAVSIIGEVQGNPHFAEKPGNLLLGAGHDQAAFEALARRGRANGTHLWLQLGHAGAMAYPPISTPRGPSALDLPGLTCAAMTRREILDLPAEFARTASLARSHGFGGVQIHAAHGFLLSQFLSPLFNLRDDEFGGSIENRMRLLLDTIAEVRAAVGPGFPVAVKLNSSDQLQGGLEQADALKVVAALEGTSLDLLDISGGTYFPGAKSASDSAGGGPYFLDFARRARPLTKIPLMLTGGFKTLEQAGEAVSGGAIDVVGLARALVLEPDLANIWQAGSRHNPQFPKFASPPEGGITAWYSMRLTQLAEDRETAVPLDFAAALESYEARDAERTDLWQRRFPR
ncbi:MAG: oxidoreductase [Hoeflea sp.]|uniref:NADH:flavin oxidoreductase/NADH oxidase family protein n=1 Tax=Hoeflea sp. TaxID=1940281 RepID=UPI000C122872|nr:NADH:flavin oxidoreductase/NADH oxidase family protein [Hoeflea sp.]PHR24721.1 MAG: oxidoreductase [Hoeflea sp.]